MGGTGRHHGCVDRCKDGLTAKLTGAAGEMEERMEPSNEGSVRVERTVRQEHETPEDPGSVASSQAGPSLLRGDTNIHPAPLSSNERERRREHLTPAEMAFGIDA